MCALKYAAGNLLMHKVLINTKASLTVQLAQGWNNAYKLRIYSSYQVNYN